MKIILLTKKYKIKMKTLFFVNVPWEDMNNSEAAKVIMYQLTQIGVAAKVYSGVHICMDGGEARKFAGGWVETDLVSEKVYETVCRLKDKIGGNDKILLRLPTAAEEDVFPQRDKFAVCRQKSDLNLISTNWLRDAEKICQSSGIFAECFMQCDPDGMLRAFGYRQPETDARKWKFVVSGVATRGAFRIPEFCREKAVEL